MLIVLSVALFVSLAALAVTYRKMRGYRTELKEMSEFGASMVRAPAERSSGRLS